MAKTNKLNNAEETASILSTLEKLSEPTGENLEAAIQWDELADELMYLAQQCKAKVQEIGWNAVKALGSEYYSETGKYEIKENGQTVKTVTAPVTLGEAIRTANGNKFSWFCKFNRGTGKPSIVFRDAFDRKYKIGASDKPKKNKDKMLTI